MLRTRDRSWNEAIKALRYPRFVWSGSRGAWYVQHTANLPFPKYPLENIARQLRDAGATVEVRAAEPESTPLSIAEQEAQRKERALGKSERYAKYAAAAAKRMAQAQARSQSIAERFFSGQPILIGHHSEKRARRDQERMHGAMIKAAGEDRKAQHWVRKATGAKAAAARREDPGVVVRRLERLAADLRDVERRIQGSPGFVDDRLQIIKPSPEYKARLDAEAANIKAQIEHWQNSLGTRGLRPFGPNDFRLGQAIGGAVVRAVGPKSVTLIRGSFKQNRWGNAVDQENYWTEPFEYRRLKPTNAPDPGPAPEPEAKGKHPRAALIDAIYAQHPTDARFRLGWKHVIGQLTPGTSHVEPYVLEDLDDAVILALAQSKGLSEGARKTAHPDQRLIKAIWDAWPKHGRNMRGRTDKGELTVGISPSEFAYFGLDPRGHYDMGQSVTLADLTDEQREYLAAKTKPPIDTAALQAQGRRGK